MNKDGKHQVEHVDDFFYIVEKFAKLRIFKNLQTVLSCQIIKAKSKWSKLSFFGAKRQKIEKHKKSKKNEKSKKQKSRKVEKSNKKKKSKSQKVEKFPGQEIYVRKFKKIEKNQKVEESKS